MLSVSHWQAKCTMLVQQQTRDCTTGTVYHLYCFSSQWQSTASRQCRMQQTRPHEQKCTSGSQSFRASGYVGMHSAAAHSSDNSTIRRTRLPRMSLCHCALTVADGGSKNIGAQNLESMADMGFICGLMAPRAALHVPMSILTRVALADLIVSRHRVVHESSVLRFSWLVEVYKRWARCWLTYR